MIEDVLTVSADTISRPANFYDRIAAFIEVDGWKVSGIDQLIDAIVWGGVAKRRPPYKIIIYNLSKALPEVRKEVKTFESEFRSATHELLANEGRYLSVTLTCFDEDAIVR